VAGCGRGACRQWRRRSGGKKRLPRAEYWTAAVTEEDPSALRVDGLVGAGWVVGRSVCRLDLDGLVVSSGL
jgi:hypothetical protein